MPTRQKKTIREVTPLDRSKTHFAGRPVDKRQQKSVYHAGNSTRVNAFVNSLGRRNQAKRDAR